MSRIIILIPKEVYDKIKVNFCNHHSGKLYTHITELITCQSIPYMSIIENPNWYAGKMDRCCSCDCDNRYQYFRVHKDEIEGFITTQKNNFMVFHDETF